MAGLQKGLTSRTRDRLVTIAVDDNMAYAACVLTSSLKHSAREPFRIVLGYLRGTLSGEHQQLIRGVSESLDICLEFEELEPDPRFISQGHISSTTFTKFQLSDLHEGAHVWIDADTVALPGWDSLFDVITTAPPSAGLVVAERGDIGARKQDDNPSRLPFNAGVLGWPAGARRDWSAALNHLGLIATQEQALLNKLYAETATRVSEKFNALTYRFDSLNPNDLPFIVHYAGAHKPWQLSHQFRNRCVRHQCPWAQWFAAEELLHLTLPKGQLSESLARVARSAMTTGRTPTGRQGLGLRLINTMNGLGALGWVLVFVATMLRPLIPRGTHPFH